MTTRNTYKFYLNGVWRESSSEETIEISSPYLHEVIGQVQAITRGGVDEAIVSAKAAQKSWAEASSTRSRKIFI
ncbi:aldehyde dehydrogenase family protein [Bacillus arachidis]|uniref:aldehyde dehydrogenase family protein n=1 Tax=Bacillus arachidis TaxID=2819290 RepID=UPI00255C7014|nr:aldehyde dehydrogenase family protein [Bacillus arachidis]WIY59609.1 aldehyde dehydrogenase family protein [Bacillus arachidis]